MKYKANIKGSGYDDTPRIQQAFDDLKASGGVLELMGHVHVSKLNFTDNSSVSVRGLGCGSTIIHPIANVSCVIDISGSYFMELSNFRLGMPDNGVIPAVGIMGLQSDPIKSNWLRFANLYVDGKYDVASIYVSGIASSKMDGCAFWNRQPGRYCAVFSSDNISNMHSDYTATVTNGPMSDWLFSGCEIHHYNEPGETPGYAMMLRGARQIKFDSGNMSGGANELVSVETAADGTECADLVFDKQTYYVEPGQPLFGCAFNVLGHVNKIAVRSVSNQSATLVSNAANIDQLAVS